MSLTLLLLHIKRLPLLSPMLTIAQGKSTPPQSELHQLTPSQFHVDKLSSAHIYLRMEEGQDWDKLPEDLVTDLAQLTKANSIEGNKKDNITVIYTPWSNLKKDGSMEVGQVTFKDPRKVSRKYR